MIAMLIGVFLMAGVIQIFLSAKQAYRLQENLSRLQENGRFAMDFMTKDIRMAGFAGCASKTPANNIATPANNPIPDQLPTPTVSKPSATVAGTSLGINGADGANVTVSGWNGTAYPAACGTSPANQCLAGTDVISLQSASSCGGQVTGVMVAGTPQIQISTTNTCGISANDILVVANCTNADIFVANSYTAGTIVYDTSSHNVAKGLSALYGTDAEVFAAKLISYYIRTGLGGVASLYRIDNTKASSTSNPAELIEGIENMQILYGIDIPDAAGEYDYIPNYYVPADSAWTANAVAVPPVTPNWKQVVSVRINLLAVTIDNNLTDDPQPYFYNGTTVTKGNLSIASESGDGTKAIAVLKTDTSQLCPAYTGGLPSTCQLVSDRRIHRVFSTTIAVRNRLI
jgi:type IV pilus assembly protein PilW